MSAPSFYLLLCTFVLNTSPVSQYGCTTSRPLSEQTVWPGCPVDQFPSFVLTEYVHGTRTASITSMATAWRQHLDFVALPAGFGSTAKQLTSTPIFCRPCPRSFASSFFVFYEFGIPLVLRPTKLAIFALFPSHIR